MKVLAGFLGLAFATAGAVLLSVWLPTIRDAASDGDLGVGSFYVLAALVLVVAGIRCIGRAAGSRM